MEDIRQSQIDPYCSNVEWKLGRNFRMEGTEDLSTDSAHQSDLYVTPAQMTILSV